MNQGALKWLFKAMRCEVRLEQIAQVLLHELHLNPSEQIALQKVAQNCGLPDYAVLPEPFEVFSNSLIHHAINTAFNLFTTAQLYPKPDSNSPKSLAQFLEQLSPEIHKSVGSNDYKQDRLNRQQRSEFNLDLSRRQYNKLFRYLARLEAKRTFLLNERILNHLRRISKKGFIYELSWKDFASDVNTACLLAYLAKSYYYDDVCALLVKRCLNSATTHWWSIAHVLPRQAQLDTLSLEQQGQLLGLWFKPLQTLATQLEEVFHSSSIQRERMIMGDGQDSMRWNGLAQCWNTIREHWLTLIANMNLPLCSVWCFGKVLPLTELHIAQWQHQQQLINRELLVWNALPLPWEILQNHALCTYNIIVSACQEYGVDWWKTSWLYCPVQNTEFQLDSELLHGISLTNPALVTLLNTLQK